MTALLELVGKEIGQYRVVRPIGGGGFGMVFDAEHLRTGQRRALKVLHAGPGVDPQAAGRFFNEARAAALLDHPNIVRVLDFEWESPAGPYLVMELLVGETLAQRMRGRRENPLLPRGVARIVHRIAAALGAAHARGVVHRDLKPENIFLVQDETHPGEELVKVLDFGLAKLRDSLGGASVVTRQDVQMGTPIYMSPEQCAGGRDIDHRSDLYSLGVVTYEALAGLPPFLAVGRGEIKAMHVSKPAPSMRDHAPSLSETLDRVVLRALEKDPSRRWPTAESFAAALGEAAGWSPRDADDERRLVAPSRALPPPEAKDDRAADEPPLAGSGVPPTPTETDAGAPTWTKQALATVPPRRALTRAVAVAVLATATLIVLLVLPFAPFWKPRPASDTGNPTTTPVPVSVAPAIPTPAVPPATAAAATAAPATTTSAAPPLPAELHELSDADGLIGACAGKGRLTIKARLQIDAAGDPIPATMVLAPTAKRSDVSACVDKVIRGLHFAAPSRAPFQLSRVWTLGPKSATPSTAASTGPSATSR
ncbi:MAG TPA: serine/threonine-protein kinase [Myxococcota bacterium]|nr:serine/threonine-protein kinase [Myxococcota bacterium]